MCANILSNSSKVELQGEIPSELAEPTLHWLAAIKEEFGEDDDRVYRASRLAFRSVSKASPVKRKGAQWFGHKTPRHEQRFGLYESLFDDPDRPTFYVYCLRNPFKVWRSCKAMPWNRVKDVRAFLRSWTSSVEAYECMQSRAPDRVLRFVLDDMLAAPSRRSWLEQVIFRPLGIEQSSFRQTVDALANTNSAVAKFGIKPPELPPADVRQIASDRRVRRIASRYFSGLEREMAAALKAR